MAGGGGGISDLVARHWAPDRLRAHCRQISGPPMSDWASAGRAPILASLRALRAGLLARGERLALARPMAANMLDRQGCACARPERETAWGASPSPLPATPKWALDDARATACPEALLTRHVSKAKLERSFPVDASAPTAYQCHPQTRCARAREGYSRAWGAWACRLGTGGALRALNGASCVGPQRAVSA
jgi:hypothetical protein